MKQCLAKTWIALIAIALMAGSCGGKGEESLQSEASEDPSITEPAASEVADSETVDESVDSDTGRVDESEGSGPASIDNLAPLSAEDSGAELIALMESIHGPTDDISAEFSQLMPFPQVPTPAGAHIMEVGATPGGSASRTDTTTQVHTYGRVKVGGTPPEVVEEFEAGLAPLGWTLENSQATEEFNSVPAKLLEFETSDAGRGRETLSIKVIESHEDFKFVVVELSYIASKFPDPDSSISLRFADWHGPLPLYDDAAKQRRNSVGSSFGPGRTELTMSAEYSVDELPKQDDAMFAKLVDRFTAEGLEFRESGSSLSLDRDPFERFEVGTGRWQTVQASLKFETPPLDSATAVVGEEKSENALPTSDASADEIQSVVTEIHGPTVDVSTQMQRLGAFPNVPTPDGADVIGLTSGVQKVTGNDDVRSSNGRVQMYINGEFDDVVTFYDAQLASLGWTEASSKTSTTDDGLSSERRSTYDLPKEEGEGTTFALTITDDVDKKRTRVDLVYSELVPTSNSGIERWQAWYGNGPFPDGGELISAGVTTFGWSGSGVFYSAEVLYPNRKHADMKGDIEAAIKASDYAIADGETLGEELKTKLVNPNFVNAEILLAEVYTAGDSIKLDASRQRQ